MSASDNDDSESYDDDVDDDDEFDESDGPVTTKNRTFSWGSQNYSLRLKHQRFSVDVKARSLTVDGNGGKRRKLDTVTAVTSKKRNRNEDEIVGLLQGNLLQRPNSDFFGCADEVSQELWELAMLFCNKDGYADRFNDPKIDDDARRGGGFFQIYIVEVHPEHQGRDLGLKIVHENLTLLKNQWTLSVMIPCTLNDRYCRWSKNHRQYRPGDGEILSADHDKVRRHFARMGFSQAGEDRAWFLTHNQYLLIQTLNFVRNRFSSSPLPAWLSKEKALTIEIRTKQVVEMPTGLDKHLFDKVCEYHHASSPARLEIVHDIENLVNRGAVIEASLAMQYAAANHTDVVVFQLLLRLGGNVNAGDSLKNTPLHVAASNKRSDMIEYLLRIGANPSATNSDGMSPLGCLLDTERNDDDFRATFDFEFPDHQIPPTLNSIRTLMPESHRSLLRDGWMSPRMKEMLLTTADIYAGTISEENPEYEAREPISIHECCAWYGISLIEYIPASVLTNPVNRNGLYKDFHDGWGSCFTAIESILRRHGVAPTVSRVEQYLESDIELSQKYRYFVEHGGKAEFAVDAVISTTRNVAINGDDGWEYVDFQEEIEAHPSTPLDRAFHIARFKCINEGGGDGTRRGPYRETRRLGDHP